MLSGIIKRAYAQHVRPLKATAEQRASAPTSMPLPPALDPQVAALGKDVVAIHAKIVSQEERVRSVKQELHSADARATARLQEDPAPLPVDLPSTLALLPGEVAAYLPTDHEALQHLKEEIVHTAEQAAASQRHHEAFLAELQHLGQDMDSTLQKVRSTRQVVQETLEAETAEAQQRRLRRKEQLQYRLAVKQQRRQQAANGKPPGKASLPLPPPGLLRATAPAQIHSSAAQHGDAASATARFLHTASATAAAAAGRSGGPATGSNAGGAPSYVPTVFTIGQPAASKEQPTATSAATHTPAAAAASAALPPAANSPATAAPPAAMQMSPPEPAVEAPPAHAGGAADSQQLNRAPTVQLNISIKCPTDHGQRVYVVGSHPALGSWDTKGAVRMKWHEGHVWRASVDLDVNSGTVEFKAYLVPEDKDRKAIGKPIWEQGPNKKVLVEDTDLHSSHGFKAR